MGAMAGAKTILRVLRFKRVRNEKGIQFSGYCRAQSGHDANVHPF
jgi:hypothetical protein